MKTLSDPIFRRDIFKILFGALAFFGFSYVFLFTPSLSTPTWISLIVVMLVAPLVTSLERQGVPRALSIGIIFALFFGGLAISGVLIAQWAETEWASFKTEAPAYFDLLVSKTRHFEGQIRQNYAFLGKMNLTESLVTFGKSTAEWFVSNSADLAGSFLSVSFIAPILSFVLLNDGPIIRKRFYSLIPNRIFESFFQVSYQITTAISDYLRAKIVEATLVGLMIGLGLGAVGAPFAVLLGFVGGITNILPYLGPVIGAVPGILAVAFAPDSAPLMMPVILVYVIANIIDNVLIFPVVVAKLVNLHPIILIAVVIVGQQYYGLVGMLISIPIASAIKVILIEIYSAIYERGTKRRTSIHDEETALLSEVESKV
jgi:putative permease